LLVLVIFGCRAEPAPEPEVTPTPAAAPSIERPADDPCVLSYMEIKAEGGRDLIPEERVHEGLQAGVAPRAVPRTEGEAGALRVVYLLTPLDGDAGWSLGIKSLWEVMDGPLRQPVSVDLARDLAADVDLEVAAREAFEGLAGTLTFRCRLSTVPAEALPGLRADLVEVDDLVAWSRACGDRDMATCGEGLVGLLADPRERVAAAAALALGMAGVESAIPAMVERTTRADPLVVRAVVLALGELGTEEARRYLRLWSEGHPDPEVKGLAAEMMELD